jgi:hypothetical protein
MCFGQKLFFEKTLVVQQGVMTNFKSKLPLLKGEWLFQKWTTLIFSLNI